MAGLRREVKWSPCLLARQSSCLSRKEYLFWQNFCVSSTTWEFVKLQTDSPLKTPILKPSETPQMHNPTPIPDNYNPEPDKNLQHEIPEKRIRKPTQRLKDLMEGWAVSSNLPRAPQIPLGVQLPTEKTNDVVLEGEGTADWMMAVDYVDEYAMAADTGEVDVRGHPPNPVSLMKSDNPAPTSIPTPYVPPHRRVHFKDLIVT